MCFWNFGDSDFLFGLWISLSLHTWLSAKYSRKVLGLQWECGMSSLWSCVVIFNTGAFCVWSRLQNCLRSNPSYSQSSGNHCLRCWNYGGETWGLGHSAWGELMLMIQISLPSRLSTLFWAMTVEYITRKCLSRLHWTELSRWKLWSMTWSLFLNEKWLHLEHCSWRGVGWGLAVLLDSSWNLSANHSKRSQRKH